MDQKPHHDALRLLAAEFAGHLDVAHATERAVAASFGRLVEAGVASIKAGGKIVLFGNGGSAADAQHLAAEFVVRLKSNRPAMAALALSTDTSILTAVGNDFGYEHIFERQIEALARSEDTIIAISTSGNSPNVLLAAAAARKIGCVVAGLTGAGGGKLNQIADPLLAVPASDAARIQEMHILIGHALCAAIEQECYG